MKNNKLYKILLLLFNLFPICIFAYVYFFMIDPKFGWHEIVLDGTVSDAPTIFSQILSYFGKFILILGIYVLVFRSLTNIITRKDYKESGFNIFAKTMSIIVCVCLALGAYHFIHNASGNISLMIYFLFILLIPLIMIWALDRLFRLKYEIKDKKYILLFVFSIVYIAFGIYMFSIENISYTSFGVFQFSFYIESALIPICLVNIYTLLVVRETNIENKKKEIETVEIEKPKTTRTRKAVKKEEN